jgi:phosphatidylinositol alpha 1,6-mannosyltransferase
MPVSGNTPRMRVAYFAGSMKKGHDGVTRVLYRTIDALQSAGIESVFFSPIIPPPEERPVPMCEVPSVVFPFYKDYRYAVPGSKYFEQKLREFRPDLMHIHSPCPLGHAAVHYGHRNGIPVVATYHTHFPSYAKYYNIKILEMCSWNHLRKLYNDCAGVFVPSEPIRQELCSHGFVTTELLPHGVDTGEFNPSFRSEEWRDAHGLTGKTVLLFAGRLVWEKDLRVLAAAYHTLMAKRADIVFVLAGDGPVRDELTRMMPGALFLGQQSGTALSRAYASSDIFVFPSTTETFGNVTLEAMASGLPPVCARKGGAGGLITPGVTGMLAEPQDAGDLARHIEFLLDLPVERRRIAEAALRFAREQSWDNIFARLFARYGEVKAEWNRKRRRAA